MSYLSVTCQLLVSYLWVTVSLFNSELLWVCSIMLMLTLPQTSHRWSEGKPILMGQPLRIASIDRCSQRSVPPRNNCNRKTQLEIWSTRDSKWYLLMFCCLLLLIVADYCLLTSIICHCMPLLIFTRRITSISPGFFTTCGYNWTGPPPCWAPRTTAPAPGGIEKEVQSFRDGGRMRWRG